MRNVLLAAALVFVAAGCSQPEFYEMEPTSLSFESRGESKAVRAAAKNRRGQAFPERKPTEWTSSDEAVATVDQEGLITAVGPGRARIVATRGQLRGEVMVDVNSVEAIEVEPPSIELAKDGRPMRTTVRLLDYRGKPLQGRSVSSRCLDQEICTTDRSHGIWPHNPGETHVEFKSGGQRHLVKVVVR